MVLLEGYIGSRFTACFVRDDRDRCPLQVAVDELPLPDQRKFVARVRRLCDVGPREMPDCARVDSVHGIWKLRVSHHFRLYFFEDGRRLVLTNGEWKTRKADDPHSLLRAVEWRREYDAQKA